MAKRKRAPGVERPRCAVCSTRFTPPPNSDQGEPVADRCGMCRGQLVLPLPPVRGVGGRFISLRGAS